MESDWVLLTPSDELQTGVFGSQELADGVLAPPLAPIRQRLAPPAAGVDGLIPVSSQRWATLDFVVAIRHLRGLVLRPRRLGQPRPQQDDEALTVNRPPN
jgi:hypothetical protein